ncbi:unnamed protein product [Diamesa serratosioi]
MDDGKLSKNVIKGLKLLNNQINEEITKKLIVNAVKQLMITGLALPERQEIYGSDVGLEAKQADYAVCVVLVLASKFQLDFEIFQTNLKSYKIKDETISQLTAAYERVKIGITNKLSNYGNSRGLLTNIGWELQHNSNGIVYKLNLEEFDHSTRQPKTIIEMYVNTDELQSFINTLKDIERHCDKISQK